MNSCYLRVYNSARVCVCVCGCNSNINLCKYRRKKYFATIAVTTKQQQQQHHQPRNDGEQLEKNRLKKTSTTTANQTKITSSGLNKQMCGQICSFWLLFVKIQLRDLTVCHIITATHTKKKELKCTHWSYSKSDRRTNRQTDRQTMNNERIQL